MKLLSFLAAVLALGCSVKTDPVLGDQDGGVRGPLDVGPNATDSAPGAGGAGGGGGLGGEIEAAADGGLEDPDQDATPDPAADAGPDATPDAGPIEEVLYAPCAHGTRVGGFTTSLEDGYTAVQGQVLNGTNPGSVEVEQAAEGACRLWVPPSLFCDPACEVGTTCGAGGCVALPTAVDVGQVDVAGLLDPVTMRGSAPVHFYSNRGTLRHPGFVEGAPITLSAAGADPVVAFSLSGQGVLPLVPEGTEVALAAGSPVSLRWGSPAAGTAARVRIDLNIANHGGTPARIECVVPDTGAFDLPVGLTDQLLALGASGFPRVVLVRETVDSLVTAVGCVDFRVQSAAVLDVEIPGLISCSFDEDCPEGQICRPDLTCGET